MIKQFLMNPSKNIVYALTHPSYTFKVLSRDLISADERMLASILGITIQEVKRFLNEPLDIPEFISHLKECENVLKDVVGSIGGDLYRKTVLAQYAIIRALKPEIVLETGVANGISTAYILLAMKLNKIGTLYSIDIADGSHLPQSKTVGWMVPDWLSPRWKFQVGDSKIMLPILLKELNQVDIFIHDSLHTQEHMMFEFQQAYPYVKPKGLILSDDAVWNSAIVEFAKSVKAEQMGIVRGLGILKKN